MRFPDRIPGIQDNPRMVSAAGGYLVAVHDSATKFRRGGLGEEMKPNRPPLLSFATPLVCNHCNGIHRTVQPLICTGGHYSAVVFTGGLFYAWLLKTSNNHTNVTG